MKKLLSVIAILISLNSYSQNLDTVSVSVTLRAQDWAWAVGKFGAGTDSVSRARIRALRTAITAANPQTWATNVTINSVNGNVVMWLYNSFLHAGFGEVLAMGNNTAERTTIYTNIRAISNTALQYWIGVSDASLSNAFTNSRNDGKTILIDN
jgi:hypothetical protein